jgi:hypothetical protein
MAGTSQKQTMIQQGRDVVTVGQGQVPIIEVSDAINAERPFIMALNFVRSGAPAVQFLVPRFVNADDVRDALDRLVTKCFLPGEEIELIRRDHDSTWNHTHIITMYYKLNRNHL